MPLFSKRTKKEPVAKVKQYEIGIMVLKGIPYMQQQFITLNTFNTSVTELTQPEIEQEEGDELVTIPEIVFNLIRNGNKISLSEILLPNQTVIANKATISQDKTVEEIDEEGNEYLSKLVYDLDCFSRDDLIEIKEMSKRRAKREQNIINGYEDRLQEMENSIRARINEALVPYKKKTALLEKELDKVNSQLVKVFSNAFTSKQEILNQIVKNIEGENNIG